MSRKPEIQVQLAKKSLTNQIHSKPDAFAHFRSSQMPISLRNKFMHKTLAFDVIDDLPELGKLLKVPWVENLFTVP